MRVGGLVVAGLAVLAAAPAVDAPGAVHSARSVRLLLLGRFDEPVYLTSPPGDRTRRFVVERAGRIRVLSGRRVLGQPFLDISSQVSTAGEGGLLSMAFAPDYAQSRKLYLYYTDNAGFIRIEEYERSRSDPDRALPGSRRLLIRQPHHQDNHKGGQLKFGPDGLLYAGLGDGGGEGDPYRNGQRLTTLLGKLIRIDPHPRGSRPYGIPRGNPFVARRGRDEIFAYGLRNPYRFSFDRRKGHLAIGDVGQDEREEIDFVPRRRGARAPRGGENFGWSLFEGRHRYRPGRIRHYVPPVLQRTHREGFCAIIGGYVIRDRSLGRRLYGRYVYGDNCEPRLWAVRLRRRRAFSDRALGLRVPGLSSFGEDARGRVYAISLRGPVYRLGRR